MQSTEPRGTGGRSLLNIAMSYESARKNDPKPVENEDELRELAYAWFEGIVSTAQANHALGMATTGSVCKMATAYRRWKIGGEKRFA